MATFTNRATLSYNGRTVDSNTVTGTFLQTLTVTKTPLFDTYTAGGPQWSENAVKRNVCGGRGRARRLGKYCIFI